MESFTTFTSVAAPIDATNIDTDQIIPAEFLRKPRSAGFGRFLFYRHRFDDQGREIPGFALNVTAFRSARILVTGANFGCGSSRESAVWALVDPVDDPGVPGRFRVIIAPSFGDIFYNNASKNGLLCVRLASIECDRIRRQLHDSPGATVTVALGLQRVRGPDGAHYSFEIDPFRKECLLRGIDDIDLTLGYADAIRDWEERTRSERPWDVLC